MRFLLLTLLVALTACGGGGGGGGGGGASDSQGIRILHSSIDSTPVDVAIDDAVIAGTTARFAVPIGYKSFGGGQKNVNLVSKGDATKVLFSFANDFDSRLGYSILLYGTREAGLSASLIADSPPELASGEVAVRVANGVSNSSSINVIINGVNIPTVARGGASDYIILPTASLQISALSAGGQQVAGSVATVQPNSVNTVLIAGEVGYFVKAVVY